MHLELYHLINRLFVILIDIFGIWLFFWVYAVAPKKKTNQWFALLTVSILAWVNAGYFLSFSTSLRSALFWARFAPSAVFVFLVVFYYFVIYFPREAKEYIISRRVILFIGLFLAIVTFFSSFIIHDVEFTVWGVNPVFTLAGKLIFYGIVSAVVLLTTLLLIKKYTTLAKEEKLKTQYFFIGLFIFVSMNVIFNILLPLVQHSIKYWQFGNYSVIFLLGFTAYAIVRRQLFDIKVVLTELLVGMIGIVLLVQVFTAPSPVWKILNGIIFILFIIFGYFLIQATIREIRRREEVERISKAKSEFISIASHQLRTPLTIVKGYISMLLEGTYGRLSERVRRPLRNVYKSNERLIGLVNNLLNVSRIEAGKIEMKLERTSLEDIISSVVSEMKIKARQKNLYLRWEQPKNPMPEILIDRGKIRQVIMNIIDNAIKYTEKGGITIKLKIENSKLKIIISDTGAGLTKYEISKMFESFSRGMAGPRLYTEGVGLGLYIARRFVEMHNGKIWAESEGKGKGSTFYIELPVR